MGRTTRIKALMEYEQHPPRCSSCEHFSPQQCGSPAIVIDGKELAPALRHIASHCKEFDRDGQLLGGFAVSPGGICNEWVHRITKETLE